MITNIKARLILTYVFNIIDLIVTMYLVRLFGLSIEGNPIGRWLIKTNLQYFVKIVIIGALLLEIGKLSKGNCKKIANIASWVMIIAYSILIFYHIVILLRL